MYKIGTKVPFSGVIIKVDVIRYNNDFNKVKTYNLYTVKDEHGVEVRLEEKDVKKLMED